MEWLGILLLGGLGYYFLRQLDRRFENLEENRGVGYPIHLSISLRRGIVNSRHFDTYTNQKKSLKDIDNWTEKQISAYGKAMMRGFGEFDIVHFTYLPSDNAWFVSCLDKRGDYSSYMSVDEKLIYTEFLQSPIYKKTGIREYDIKVWIYSRYIKIGRSHVPVLTGYVEYCSDSIGKKSKYQHLFDFPYTEVSLAEKMGFEVDSYEGGYLGPKPDFALDYYPGSTKFEKNGVCIEI